MGKQATKIRTNKYVIYALSGQVYLGGKYFRTLTESQLDFLNSQKWTGKKDKLDSLIDGGDDTFEAEQALVSRTNSTLLSQVAPPEIDYCTHSWLFLEKVNNNYGFFCKKCLEIEVIESPHLS